MSNQQSLTQFFATKFFQIPKYQRSYAWERQNIRELFEDIQEALETNSNHYIGTVVLARTNETNVFNIVDGQQRITTIVMFIAAIISRLKDKDDQDYYRRYYIKQRDQFKLIPLERDKEFYFKILDGKLDIEPKNKSQRYMLEACDEMLNILDSNTVNPSKLLDAIGALSILEFVEDHESDAIRIFQTVNDRGRDLSRTDKMKSLLFYFSNKYLNKKYDDEINNKFAEIFELYDNIKLTGEERKINIISSKQFNEDDLLRHHHICFSEDSYDPTSQQVLDNVKYNLITSRKKSDWASLDNYISEYLESLLSYVRAFNTIIARTVDNKDYYKLFSILGLSAVYYPAITQLEKQSFLDQLLISKNITILKMIEIIDVRVLKIREYAGKKIIADFAYNLNKNRWNLQELEDHLLWFNSHQISNDRFKDYLASGDYSKQTGLLRTLFIDYCERLGQKTYTLAQLEKLMDSEPTIEHILSQTPKFKPKAFGFKDEEEFDEYKDRIGNLSILEKKINSAIKNSDLVDKMVGYSKSTFKMTALFATYFATTKTFKKSDLTNRGQSLVDDFAERWWA